jgi:hypothetical protein
LALRFLAVRRGARLVFGVGRFGSIRCGSRRSGCSSGGVGSGSGGSTWASSIAHLAIGASSAWGLVGIRTAFTIRAAWAIFTRCSDRCSGLFAGLWRLSIAAFAHPLAVRGRATWLAGISGRRGVRFCGLRFTGLLTTLRALSKPLELCFLGKLLGHLGRIAIQLGTQLLRLLLVIDSVPTTLDLRALQATRNLGRAGILHVANLRSGDSQRISTDLGAEDIIPIIPALDCDIGAAIEAQTADRLSTFTHDDIILGTFVIDDVVNVRDVRDVPSLTDHGDRFARREEHGGKTGSTKLANLDERVVSGTDIIIAVRPSLNPYLVAEVCLGR